MDKRTEEGQEEEIVDFLTLTDKFPNFDFERFLVEQHVDHRMNEADDHVEFSINCPECLNHGEPTPDSKKKLWINPKKGFGICYRCGFTGGLVHIVQSIMQTSYMNALRIMKGRSPEGIVNFKLLAYQNNWNADDGTELKEIELPYGFEPITGPHPYLQKRGIPWQYAAHHGWGTCDAGYLKDRIIVPFYMGDKLVFWQARATFTEEEWPKLRTDPEMEFKKVLNPKGVSARHVLYNFNTAANYEDIVLVEGFIDACKVGPNAMATNGKALHPEQAAWLLKTKAKTITILWDKDSWSDGRERKGKKVLPSAIRAIKTLREFSGWEIKYVKELPKKDPGEFKYGSKLLKRLISEAKTYSTQTLS